MRRIGVLGAGYVGLTTAACLAARGHDVSCMDIDSSRVAELDSGVCTVDEPGLAELVESGRRANTLAFTDDGRAAVTDADVVFACLPTPCGDGGAADTSALFDTMRELREHFAADTVLVIKSTVPVGTAAELETIVARPVVSNPEFLREGHAVEDFRKPGRVVLGGADEPIGRVAELYGDTAPIVRTDTRSAELTKYAANAFLAMRLSYVNSLGELAESVGADVADVLAGLAGDERIGALATGPGWGGPCLPKDTAALCRIGADHQVELPLVRATLEANHAQCRRVVEHVRRLAGGNLAGERICVLGLAFKAGVADVRDSPAVAVAAGLAAAGAEVIGHDPLVEHGPAEVAMSADPYLAAKDARVIVVLTGWDEYRRLDWTRLARRVQDMRVLDTRDVVDTEQAARAGFTCHRLGRPPAPAR